MSITNDDFIQVATGSITGVASTNVTLPNPTAEGNTVILCVFTTGTSGAAATGFTRDHGVSGSAPRTYVLRKSDVTGGENSWSVIGLASAPVTWVALELQGLHPTAPRDAISGAFAAQPGVTAIASPTSPQTLAYEGLALYFWGAYNSSSSTIPTLGTPTGDAQIITGAVSSRTDGSTATTCAVGTTVMMEPGTFQSTVTSSATVDGSAVVVCYVAANSRRVPNIEVMTGAEQGTAAGLATGVTGAGIFDAVTGSVAVSTSAPHSGSYHYRLTGAGAAANASWTSTGAFANYTTPTGIADRVYGINRFSVRFPTALPSADVMLAAIEGTGGSDASGNGAYLIYRNATQKLGVYVRNSSSGVTGTEVASSVTLVADTWYEVDFMGDFANANRQSAWRAWWRVGGAEQTTATVATATATATLPFTSMRFGWQGALTAIVDLDDLVASRHPGHFPLGRINIYPLTVDPAATPSVTNAATFSTMASNGTITSAFSTTTARNAVDELPPTIGASADGFVQDATGTADYVELPMGTRNAAANLEALRAIRVLLPGWAAAAGPTTGATIGFRSYDGTAETTLFAAAEPNFTNSTTVPTWVARMHRTLASNTPPTLTQARLDALAVRVGFSGDASPVVGVHAVYAEVAMAAAVEQQVVEQDGVFCYALLDPDTGNCIAIRLVAPVDGAATGTYTINGATVVRNAAAGGTDLYTVGAETNAVVSSISAGRS